MKSDQTNTYFDLAIEFVNCTTKHVFVTGKAGTGKTTFLKYIRSNSHKKLVVVAPTGVAAMNAGGVTIHSFFQLPLGTYVPALSRLRGDSYQEAIYDRNTLLSRLRLSGAKRELIREMEVLVIDEVSMVRPDMLDAIDVVLRFVRRRNDLPFGGVQVVYIGDLFQLPPVISDSDKTRLKEYYDGQFFFNARVFAEAPPLSLELKKIYRQSDEDFIRILNLTRANTLAEEDYRFLNSFYRPGFKPEGAEPYITLTSHNARAHAINQTELDRLPGRLHSFKAEVKGEFNSNTVVVEENLRLKEGAQIMFVRNDSSERKRYFNGKLGTVKKIREDQISVAFEGEEEELLVGKESWENIRYVLDKENDRIEEEVLGTFSQYPIRLAWAITIHKSQGLTFDRAIIDAGHAFAPGQVYVALSRLRSLAGLILFSKITPEAVMTDTEVVEWSKAEIVEESLRTELVHARQAFIKHTLLGVFSFTRMQYAVFTFHKEMDTRKIPAIEDARELSSGLVAQTSQIMATATKFVAQLEQMFACNQEQFDSGVCERANAAVKYFTNMIRENLVRPLDEHYSRMKNKAKVKKYLSELVLLRQILQTMLERLEEGEIIVRERHEGKEVMDIMSSIASRRNLARLELQNRLAAIAKSEPKYEKGDSKRLTLRLFQEGKSIAAIAEERSLAISTIESHLSGFVLSGDIAIEKLVEMDKVAKIRRALSAGHESISQVKGALGDEVSFFEIRAVMNSARKTGASEAVS